LQASRVLAGLRCSRKLCSRAHAPSCRQSREDARVGMCPAASRNQGRRTCRRLRLARRRSAGAAAGVHAAWTMLPSRLLAACSCRSEQAVERLDRGCCIRQSSHVWAAAMDCCFSSRLDSAIRSRSGCPLLWRRARGRLRGRRRRRGWHFPLPSRCCQSLRPGGSLSFGPPQRLGDEIGECVGVKRLGQYAVGPQR